MTELVFVAPDNALGNTTAFTSPAGHPLPPGRLSRRIHSRVPVGHGLLRPAPGSSAARFPPRVLLQPGRDGRRARGRRGAAAPRGHGGALRESSRGARAAADRRHRVRREALARPPAALGRGAQAHLAHAQRLWLLETCVAFRRRVAAHLVECFENAKAMVFQHHIYTVSCIIPVGDFLASAAAWTGLPTTELMPLLRGSTPISSASRTNTSRRCTRSPGMPLRPRCFAKARAPGDVLAPPAFAAGPDRPRRRGVPRPRFAPGDRGLRHHQPDGNRDAGAAGSRAAIGTGSGSGGARSARCGGTHRARSRGRPRAAPDGLRRAARRGAACQPPARRAGLLQRPVVERDRPPCLARGRSSLVAGRALQAVDHVLDAGADEAVALLTGTGPCRRPTQPNSPRGMPTV